LNDCAVVCKELYRLGALTMAQKFPYERASTILAESEIFGDKKTCERWGITRQTLHSYRVRNQEDGKLLQSFTLKKRMLLVGWQQDCAKSLKASLTALDSLIAEANVKASAPLEECKAFCAMIHAVAGSVKIVGELKLAGEALSESGSEVSLPIAP